MQAEAGATGKPEMLNDPVQSHVLDLTLIEEAVGGR